MSIQQKMTVKQTSEGGLSTHNLKQATSEHDSVLNMWPRYRKCTVCRIHFEELWNKPCAADKVTGEQNFIEATRRNTVCIDPTLDSISRTLRGRDKLALNRAVVYYIAFYNAF